MRSKFGLIAADTSRTRAYLAALENDGLLPDWVLVLADRDSKPMPGQASSLAKERILDDDWPEAHFDMSAPLLPWLDRLGLDYVFSGSVDINDSHVVNLIAQSQPQLLIYSGYGGALLRRNVLSIGKVFLHVHGGYLPDFKGSTTNYYSLLSDCTFGASSIFLTQEIDCGPVLQRRKFLPPLDRSLIDHVYDSAARARVLVSTLKLWLHSRKWTYDLEDNSGGDCYYIIHPVLKHLAILSSKQRRSTI